MSSSFVVSLGIVTGLIFAARILSPALPLRRYGRPLNVSSAVLTILGVAGLTFHCTAMFFRSLVASLPGTSGAIDEINAMGTASRTWFATSAVLVIVGLRGQYSGAVAALLLALAAVGITMYDGGSLSVHLATIFVTAVVMAGLLSILVLPPWRQANANSLLSPRTGRSPSARS